MATVGTLAVELSANTRDFKSDMNAAKSDMQGFGNEAKTSLSGVLSTMAAIGATVGVMSIGQEAINKAIEYETAWVSVRKVLDGTDAELETLRQTIRDMATDSENPLSALDDAYLTLSDIAAIGGQLGITVDEMEDFLQIIGELTMSTDMSGEEAATFFGKYSAATGLPTEDFRDFADVIVTLGNNMAVTESDLATWGLRLANLSTFDWEDDDIIAYGAALNELGLNPELGATNIIKTVTDLTNAVATGTPDLETYADVAGMTVDEFTTLNDLDPEGGFNAFIKGLSEMDIDDQLQALDDLGIKGSEQQRTLITLASGYDDTLTTAIDLASDAFEGNNALMEEAKTKAETTESKINTLGNKFDDLKAKAGELALDPLTDFVEGLSDGIDAWEGNFARIPQVVTVILDEIGRDWERFLLDIEMRMGIWLTDIENKLRGTPFEVDFGINELGTMDRIADLEIVDFLQRELQNQAKSGGGIDLGTMLNFTASSGVSFAGDLGFLLESAIDQDNVSESMKLTLESAARYAIENGDFASAGSLIDAMLDVGFDFQKVANLKSDLNSAMGDNPLQTLLSGGENLVNTVIDAAIELGNEEEAKNDLIKQLEDLIYDPVVDAVTTAQHIWDNPDEFISEVVSQIEAQDYDTTITPTVTVKPTFTFQGVMDFNSAMQSTYGGGGTTVNMNVEGSVVTEQELIDTVAEGIEKGGG